MKVVISQPRYLPALNYLQRVCFADTFVLFDTVQRQARAWENRNQLLLPNTPQWLTIPIASSSRARIADAIYRDANWVQNHKARIVQNYLGAPYFDPEVLECYYSAYEPGREQAGGGFAISVKRSIERLFDYLDLPYNMRFASALEPTANQVSGPAKLRSICEQLGAEAYISGPNGREYGVIPCFAGSRCKVLFHEYRHPTYHQGDGTRAFVPYMGFFDALFNCGRSWIRDALLEPPLLVP